MRSLASSARCWALHSSDARMGDPLTDVLSSRAAKVSAGGVADESVAAMELVATGVIGEPIMWLLVRRRVSRSDGEDALTVLFVRANELAASGERGGVGMPFTSA